MKPVLLLPILLVMLLVVIAGYVRLSPSAPDAWNTDPLTATPGSDAAWLLRPEGGDAAGPLFPVAPGQALAAFDAVARAAPRTTVLAGSLEAGQLTYIQRSKLWGFPDYITVRALPASEGGSTLAIWSRSRFGKSDLGVNRARVEDWLSRIDLPRAS